jgi:DNA-binding FadR family transcriptional regulator
MSKSALAKALARSKSKSEMKRHIHQEEPKNSEAYLDAVDELYDAVKSGDKDGFKETLRAVIEIVNSEE